MTHLARLATPLAALLAFPATAQDSFDLGEIVVSGAFVPLDASAYGRAVTIVTSDDIARSGATTVQDAIALLYASAGRQKRNYIGHFATLLDIIGDHLTFPEAIPRSLGLQLEKRLTTDARLARRLVDALSAMPVTSAAKEVELLRSFAVPPARVQTGESSRPGKPSAKTSLRFEGPGGMVRCTASEGRLEIRAERDFAALDRHDLEAALEVFFQALDG